VLVNGMLDMTRDMAEGRQQRSLQDWEALASHR
jgi:hypothetical protein